MPFLAESIAVSTWSAFLQSQPSSAGTFEGMAGSARCKTQARIAHNTILAMLTGNGSQQTSLIKPEGMKLKVSHKCSLESQKCLVLMELVFLGEGATLAYKIPDGCPG